VFGHPDETLALVDIFHPWLSVWLDTGDHKPLEVLHTDRGKPSPRIERWWLRFQQYKPHIVYQPGIQNAVDILSPKPGQTDIPRDSVEDHINSVIMDSLPPSITLQKNLNQNTIPHWRSSKTVSTLETRTLHWSPLKLSKMTFARNEVLFSETIVLQSQKLCTLAFFS